MTRTRALTVLLLATLAPVAFSACSSDKESSEPTTTTTVKALTAAEFKAQANAICKKGGEDIMALFASGEDPSTLAPAAKQDLFDDVIAITRQQVNDIAALAAPAANAEAVQTLTGDIKTKTDALVEAGPDSLFATPGDPFAEFNSQFQALGLTSCVNAG